jgi:hypothetical protein
LIKTPVSPSYSKQKGGGFVESESDTMMTSREYTRKAQALAQANEKGQEQMLYEFRSIWKRISGNPDSEFNQDWPRGRSLHSCAVYKNRYFVVVAGQSSVKEQEKDEFKVELNIEYISKKTLNINKVDPEEADSDSATKTKRGAKKKV